MSDSTPHEEFDGDARFAQLVIMLSSTAMQQLGKLAHPATGKAEVDLEGAQMMIDLLEMLAEKTSGNLSEHEKHVISESLMGLRMNFVQVAQAAHASGPTPADGPTAAETAGPAAPPPGPEVSTSGSKPGDDDEGKKFHKSYG